MLLCLEWWFCRAEKDTKIDKKKPEFRASPRQRRDQRSRIW